MISVVLPTYQGGQFIRAAIESVLQQTDGDFEVVLSDDGSSDDTLEIAESFNDPRIRIYKHTHNQGPIQNWNFALEQCSGKYIKVMGQDDLLEPSCLAMQRAVLDDPAHIHINLVTCRRKIIDAEGNELLQRGFNRASGFWDGNQAMAACLKSGGNLFGEPVAGLIRQSALMDSIRFSADVPYFVDLVFWAKLIQGRAYYYQNEALCSFRLSNTAWSSSLLHEQSREWVALVELLEGRYNDLPLSKLEWKLSKWHGQFRYGILKKLFYFMKVKNRVHKNNYPSYK